METNSSEGGIGLPAAESFSDLQFGYCIGAGHDLEPNKPFRKGRETWRNRPVTFLLLNPSASPFNHSKQVAARPHPGVYCNDTVISETQLFPETVDQELIDEMGLS